MTHQPPVNATILLICDQVSTAEEVEQLSKRCESIEQIELRVIDSKTFLQSSEEHGYRIILIDDGLNALRELECLHLCGERYPGASVVMITRKSDRQRAVEFMKQGATDYFFKRDLDQAVFDRGMKNALERSEQAHLIQQRNAVIDAFFDQAEEAMFLLDGKGELVISNAVFGTYQAAVGRSEKLQQVLLDSMGASSFDALLREKQAVSEVVTLPSDKDGSRVWRIHLKRIAVQNRYRRILGVITDITAQEHSASEQQKAERLELTSRMARILAHEIRNPLTNIRLSADYIAESFSSEEELVSYSEIIERNVSRIDELIQRLLQSVRPFELKAKSTDLSQFIETFKQKIMDRAELLEAEVHISTAESLDRWNVDADKLELALLNLVSNAFEAMMHNDNPRLDIRFSSTDSEHVIEVSDNGKGMDEESRERLFEAFYSNRQGGMGLGMMMVQKIVEAHNGHIEVQSSVGEGTHFKVQIPHL